MAERSLLPFPMLVDLGSQPCLACGYPLEGIPSPGECPECGLGFDEGVSALMIHGVTKSAGGPRWRKIVWVIIALCAFAYAQVMFFLIQFNVLAAGGVFLAIVAACAGMAMTNRQKKTGTEIIVFTRFGVGHWPMDKREDQERGCLFTPWGGVKRGATIKRISSVWAGLKIRSVNEKGKHIVDFDTGFRCQAIDIPMITKILDRLCVGEFFDDIEEIELIGTRDGGLDEGKGFYIIEKPTDDAVTQYENQ